MDRRRLRLALVFGMACVVAASAGTAQVTSGPGRVTMPTEKARAAQFARGDVQHAWPAAIVVEGAAVSIPVNAMVTGLRFVQTADAGKGIASHYRKVALEKRKFNRPPAAPEVMRYTVRYEDGKSVEVPVLWNVGIGDWYRTGEVPDLLWAKARVVKEDARTGEKVVEYAMEWPNPRPGVKVAGVEVVSGNDDLVQYGTMVVLGVEAVNEKPVGGVYYVQPAPAGSDENPGTFEQPWATIHKAAATLKAGDTVYVRGGIYPITSEIAPANDGAEGAWITYAAYPGETPVIDAIGHYLDMTQQQPIRRRGPFDHDNGEFHLLKRKYIRVKGFTIENSRRCGMYVNGGDHIELIGNTIVRTYNSAIYAGYGVDQLKLLGNTAVEPCCKTMDSSNPKGEFAMIVHPAHEGITVATATNFEVAYNEVYASDKEGIDCKGSNKHGKVHHNYVHDVMAIGMYFDSYRPLMEDIEIYGNTVTDANGIVVTTEGGSPIDNFRIHHNLIYNNSGTGIAISGTKTTNVQVYNNTVYSCGWDYMRMGWAGGGLQVNEGTWDITFRNNISVYNAQWQLAKGPQDAAERKYTFTDNLLYGRMAEREPGERIVRLAGENAIDADPMFADAARGDFRLKEGSPAIGKGSAGEDLGALAYGVKVTAGLDLAGKVLKSYGLPSEFAPVTIPMDLFNARLTHRGRGRAWFGWRAMWDWDLRLLPSGDQILGDVDYYLPDYRDVEGCTLFMLKGQGAYVDETEIRGIPVNAKATALHFLHTYNPGSGLESRPVVMRYVVRYADGTSAEVPIRHGMEIDTWKRGDLKSPANAKVAWLYETRQWRNTFRRQMPAGKNWNEMTEAERTAVRAEWDRQAATQPATLIRGGLAVYTYAWTNPSPEKAIATIDIISANTAEKDYGAPAVFAITRGK